MSLSTTPSTRDEGASPLPSGPRTLAPEQKYGGSEAWPEGVEKVFVDGVRQYWESPWATYSRGRSRWRNQFLVDYLKDAGIDRSKKQVASHIQVLRNTWKGEKKDQLVAGGEELFQGNGLLAHRSRPQSGVRLTEEQKEAQSPSARRTPDFPSEGEALSLEPLHLFDMSVDRTPGAFLASLPLGLPPGVSAKVEKQNIYDDGQEDKAEDKVDKWDEEKLRSVILSHLKPGNPLTTTDIVCKYFIEAVETRKSGLLWQCPNGDSCQYRHALTPAPVPKSQKKAPEETERATTVSLEEFSEVERHKLGQNLTPVTRETFAKMRMNKREAAKADVLATAEKSSGISARDLFQYHPEWFQDSDEEEEE